jgi:hypothetical protein
MNDWPLESLSPDKTPPVIPNAHILPLHLDGMPLRNADEQRRIFSGKTLIERAFASFYVRLFTLSIDVPFTTLLVHLHFLYMMGYMTTHDIKTAGWMAARYVSGDAICESSLFYEDIGLQAIETKLMVKVDGRTLLSGVIYHNVQTIEDAIILFQNAVGGVWPVPLETSHIYPLYDTPLRYFVDY